jgi:hypothetical protein
VDHSCGKPSATPPAESVVISVSHGADAENNAIT